MASSGGGSPRDRGKQMKNKDPSTTEESSGQEDNVYEVEKILAMAKRNGKMMYKVRWLGYSPQFDTWEPYENVASCKDLVDEYMNSVQKKKRRSGSQEKPKADDGEEDSLKKKRGLPSKKDDEKMESKDSKEEVDDDVPKLKDSFWKDLEEGRINVFDGDMYSKVKGRASSKASSSDEQSSKESRSRAKAPLSASKVQEQVRRREKTKDSKSSHRKTRRHITMPTSSTEDSELDTEIVAAQSESRHSLNDSQDVVNESIADSEMPLVPPLEEKMEEAEPMDIDVIEVQPDPVPEKPKLASADKTSKPKVSAPPIKITRTALKPQQKTVDDDSKAATPTQQSKQASTQSAQPQQTQAKQNVTPASAKSTVDASPQPKQAATATSQPKSDISAATPQGKQSAASTQQSKSATALSSSEAVSTPQSKPPSSSTPQPKSGAAATLQTKSSASSKAQARSSAAVTAHSKPTIMSAPQPKTAVVTTPQSKQAAVSTPQPTQSAVSTPQPKEAATPAQPRAALLPTPQLSQPKPALLPTPQVDLRLDVDMKHEAMDITLAEKEISGSNLNNSAISFATSAVIKPMSPTEEIPARISFTFKKYNPDEWTKKDSDELTQAVVLTNGQFRNAVKRGDYEVLRRALNSNHPFNMEQADNNGTTLLMLAAIAGFDDLVELLVMHGANINAYQKNGCTALMLAAEMGHVCTVVVLLGLGAHTDVQQSNGETALMRACRKGHLQVVQLLLEHGANFALGTNSDGTALKFAKMYDHPSIEELLVDHISRLTSAFETQVNITLNNTAQINHALFPIHCFSLNEGTCFRVHFNHLLTQCQHGVGMLLFIAHARISSQEVKCRFYGQCAVTSVYLNNTKQPSLTEEANFVLSFSPLRNGRNELVINTLQTFTSKVKLFVCAYKAQLAGTTRS